MKDKPKLLVKGAKFQYEKEDKKEIKVKEILKFNKYYKQLRGPILAIVVMLVLLTTISVLSPIYSGNLIATFTSNFNARTCMRYATIILILGLSGHILSYINNFLWSITATNASMNIYNAVLNRLNYISQKSYDSASSGTFTTRLFGDINTISTVPIRLMDYFCEIIGHLSFIIYLVTLKWYLACFIVVKIIVELGFAFGRIKIRQRNQKVLRKQNEKRNSMETENLKGMRDIRGINAQDNLQASIIDTNEYYQKLALTSSYINNTYNRITQVFRTLFDFALIALCVYLITHNQIAIATVMIIYNYRGRVTGFANYISTIKEYLSDCSLSAFRLNEILDENKYPIEVFGTTELNDVKGEIAFNNVTFGYNDDDKVLDGVNFVVKPNTITSFVGMSGAGKSTIISLMTKLYDLGDNGGSITLDGINIRNLHATHYATIYVLLHSRPTYSI